MLTVHIAGKRVPVLSASLNETLDQAGEFDFTVAAVHLPNYRTLGDADVALYEDGNLLVSGIVNNVPSLEINDNEVLTVKFTCFDELGRLTFLRSKSDGHYQDSVLTGILNNLLTVAPDWQLTDTSTMVDNLITTTIDLRPKETLFAQIAEAIKSVPDVHLRYGGYNAAGGYHELHIGYFNAITTRIVQGENLVKLKLKSNSSRKYRLVESYGNRTTGRRITLADALNDARTTSHADYARYPISYDAVVGAYVVTDVNATSGGEVTKTFELQKTKNDKIPNAVEQAQAGYALWLKTVRFMKENSEYESYSASVWLAEKPQIGDKAYVRARVVEDLRNPVTQQITEVETFSVDDYYTITNVKTSFERGKLPNGTEVVLYDLELTTNDLAEKTDPILELYERLEQGSKFDDTAAQNGLNIPAPVVVSHGPGVAADCNHSGANTGKLFVFTAPPAPSWAKKVSVSAELQGDPATYVEISVPTKPGQNYSICVKPDSSNWNASSSATAYAQFIYSAG